MNEIFKYKWSIYIRRFIVNFSLFLLSIAVGIGLCEGLARVFAPLPLAKFPQLSNSDFTYTPNQQQRHVTLEWDIEININADGFREEKLLADLPENSSVFVGDSFIEGYGVALSDTAAKRLQKIQSDRGQTGVVFNAGHNNSSPNNYFQVWDRYFSKRPEIKTVIVGFFVGNDLIPAIDEGRLKGGQLGTFEAAAFRDRIRLFLNQHSMLYLLANYAIKSNRSLHHACRSVGMCGAPFPDDIYLKDMVDPQLAPTIERVASFADAAKAARQRALIVIIPAKDQVSDSGWHWIQEYYAQLKPERFYTNDAIVKGLRARCVEVLNLTEPILTHARAGGAPLYFRTDGHWSPIGHEFAARLIDKTLQAPPASCIEQKQS